LIIRFYGNQTIESLASLTRRQFESLVYGAGDKLIIRAPWHQTSFRIIKFNNQHEIEMWRDMHAKNKARVEDARQK